MAKKGGGSVYVCVLGGVVGADIKEHYILVPHLCSVAKAALQKEFRKCESTT